MGSYAGHVLPGSFFLVFSLWWWLNAMRLVAISQAKTTKKRRRQTDNGSSDLRLRSGFEFESTTWFLLRWPRCLQRIPLEPIAKILATMVGIFAELSKGDWMLINKNGDFVHLNNFSHATMFFIFLFSAFVEILAFYKVIHVPAGTEHLFLSVAFFMVGLLFYHHIDDRPVLDQKVHILLYTTAFTLAAVLLLEAWQRNSFLLLMVRIVLLIVQGTWFLQAAHILHGTKPWEDSLSNRAFVALLFCWHLMGALFLVLVSLLLVAAYVRLCGQCEPVDPGSAELLDSLMELENTSKERHN